MSLYKKVSRFMSYPLHRKWMFAEAYFYLAWGRVFKLLPFSKVAPSLGQYMKETDHTCDMEQHALLIREISRAVHTMSRVTWWESQCLVKAVAAMKMLSRRGISSTLYLGSGRDEKGQMVAHAWLRSGSYFVTGKEGHEKYTVVGVFGKGRPSEALAPTKQ